MKNFLSNTFSLIENKQKKIFIYILFLSIIGALLETLGVGIIFPFLSIFLSEANEANNLLAKYPFLPNLLEHFEISSKENLILLASLFLLVIFVVKNIFLIFLAWINSVFVLNVESKLSKKVFTLYLSQPYSFYLNRNTSSLIRNIRDEVTHFTDAIIQHVLILIVETLTVACIILLLIWINPVASITGFVLMAFTSFIYIYFTRRKINAYGVKRQYNDGMRLKHLQQSLNGIKEVKMTNTEREFMSIYDRHNVQSLTAVVMQKYLVQIPRFILELIAVSCLIIVLLIFINQSLSISNILPLLGLYGIAAFRVLPSMNRIIQCFNKIRFGIHDLNLLVKEFKELDISKDFFEKKIIKKMENFENLEIKNLSFSYVNRSQVLRNISIQISSGDVVGIIGKSGSGKSTLVDLIIGLLAAQDGKVYVNKKLIKDNLNSWQKNIGYVPQSIFLFDDTIEKNIIFGSKKKNSDSVLLNKIIKLAKLEDMISSLPEGLNTIVGERGLRISGGQKQRIGIARALYNNPDFLVFDEATNALDKETELEIIKSIKSLEKTMIIISHNMHSIKNQCNKFFVIENGNLSYEESN